MNPLKKKDEVLKKLECLIEISGSLVDTKSDKILETLKAELPKRFPEFSQTKEFQNLEEDESAYVYYMYFANYLEKIIDEDKGSEIVVRSFGFINEIYEKEELLPEAWDLIGIELFDQFERNSKYAELAEKYLTGRALSAFRGEGDRPVGANDFKHIQKSHGVLRGLRDILNQDTINNSELIAVDKIVNSFRKSFKPYEKK